MARTRQVTFREIGGTGYGKAQTLARLLRDTYDQKAGSYYVAEQGSIPSAAGSWADTVYIMTDAPLPVVRKHATKEGLTITREAR